MPLFFNAGFFSPGVSIDDRDESGECKLTPFWMRHNSLLSLDLPEIHRYGSRLAELKLAPAQPSILGF